MQVCIFYIHSCTVWPDSFVNIPQQGGLAGSLDEDIWVDVLRLGTLTFHARIRPDVQARTGSWEDFWVGRFLPVGDAGLEDLRFAASAYYARVPKLAAYHVHGAICIT